MREKERNDRWTEGWTYGRKERGREGKEVKEGSEERKEGSEGSGTLKEVHLRKEGSEAKGRPCRKEGRKEVK